MKSAALRRLISSPARNYTGYAIPDMLAERVGVAQQKGELGFPRSRHARMPVQDHRSNTLHHQRSGGIGPSSAMTRHWGSPINLRFFFGLDGGKIASLETIL